MLSLSIDPVAAGQSHQK